MKSPVMVGGVDWLISPHHKIQISGVCVLLAQDSKVQLDRLPITRSKITRCNRRKNKRLARWLQTPVLVANGTLKMEHQVSGEGVIHRKLNSRLTERSQTQLRGYADC